MAIDGCISSDNHLASMSFQVTVQGDVMAVELEERVTQESHAVLEAARAAAAANQLPYAGGVSPRDAFALVESGSAVLVDVRTTEERKFVGYVPGSVHVAWATGTSLTRNPRFVRELEAKTGKDAVVLLLCRSGNRSALAAEAAAKAGLTQVFNVLEGFEGRLDSQQQRGAQDGWRFQGLPWIQD
jgi:rhodanese-related sulfurtransferase